jgi:hypothetical protein
LAGLPIVGGLRPQERSPIGGQTAGTSQGIEAGHGPEPRHARRNVAERIDRFLNGLQGIRRLPNRRELFWLREALVNLQEGQYPAGEDAMDKAERAMPVPEHAARDLATNDRLTVEQLRSSTD